MSSLFLTGVRVYVWVCVYMHTHTHTLHMGTRCERRGRDERLGGPEKFKWTKSWYKCICKCVHSTYVYIYAGRRDEIWTNCFFLKNLPKKQSKRRTKDVNVKPRTRIEIEFKLHSPSIKGTKLLFVIKKIMINCAGSPNNLVPRSAKLNTTDVTAVTICERLV